MKRRVLFSILALIGVISFGTIGYSFVENWDIFDSLYMTIITLTTVGYNEVHDLSKAGRAFTIILVLSGVGAVLYLLGTFSRVIIEGEIREIFGRRKLVKKIEGMKNHYIICGYGRMGNIICKEMTEYDAPFVIVERSAEVLASMDKSVLAIQGDATHDDVLREAGIQNARGLISVLSSDADNLYVVLSARGLNPKLTIVARSSEETAERKLLRAGADRVISPYYIGGLRIAHTVLKPAVVDFIEFATRSGNLELQIEEVEVGDRSNLVNKSLDQGGVRKEMGVIIVAIKRSSGEMEFNPQSTSIIKIGDTLIAMGEKINLGEFTDLVRTG